jgi:biopolymer transport protein ExbD
MAGVDIGAGRPQKKKAGLKRPKRRISIRNDLTPMVDIAFLLLIFYMVTTVFSSPLSMEISLPPKPEEGVNPQEIKVAESKLLQMFVDRDDSLYYQIGADMKQPAKVSFPELAKVIDEKNRNVAKLVMVLKMDQASSYRMMVDIIDGIQAVERAINAELAAARQADPSVTQEDYSVRFSLQDMTAWDEYVLGIVKEGGTVEE